MNQILQVFPNFSWAGSKFQNICVIKLIGKIGTSFGTILSNACKVVLVKSNLIGSPIFHELVQNSKICV